MTATIGGRLGRAGGVERFAITDQISAPVASTADSIIAARRPVRFLTGSA